MDRIYEFLLVLYRLHFGFSPKLIITRTKMEFYIFFTIYIFHNVYFISFY